MQFQHRSFISKNSKKIKTVKYEQETKKIIEGENKNVHFPDFQEFIPSHLIENVKNLHIRVK